MLLKRKEEAGKHIITFAGQEDRERDRKKRNGDKEDMVKKKRVIVCLLNLKDKIILIKRE